MNPNQRQQLLALTAMICVGALIGDKLVLTPLMSMWEERSVRILELEDSLNKGQVLVTREDAMTARLAEMKAEALPANSAAAEKLVLDAMDRWARASRISLTSQIPQWREYQDEGYRTLEYRIVGVGDLESVSRFLYELERDPLALKIEDITMTARDETGEKITLGVVYSGLLFVEGT